MNLGMSCVEHNEGLQVNKSTGVSGEADDVDSYDGRT